MWASSFSIDPTVLFGVSIIFRNQLMSVFLMHRISCYIRDNNILRQWLLNLNSSNLVLASRILSGLGQQNAAKCVSGRVGGSGKNKNIRHHP